MKHRISKAEIFNCLGTEKIKLDIKMSASVNITKKTLFKINALNSRGMDVIFEKRRLLLNKMANYRTQGLHPYCRSEIIQQFLST